MIARMSKYNFVLFAAQSEDFVEKLRGLGLVDITTAGWEPSEEDRQLLLDIESLAKAAEFLKNFRAGERCDAAAAPFASGEEAYAHYAAAHREAATLNAEIGRLEKAAEELRPWGAFDVEATRKLAARGIVLRYFFTQRNTFDKQLAEWSERYTVSEVSRTDATVWFVVVAKPGEEVTLDAQEMKTPTMDIREAERRIAEAEGKLRTLDAEFSRAAASEALLAQHACSLKERLQGVRVKATAQEAADGTLVVMEGWAEKETSGRVDALLEEYPNVVFLKSDPTPEDETPVKLIFGICLNDAGYGLILTLMGWWMLARNRKPGMMRQAAWFATLCGVSTVAFGLLCGSFFGINMSTWFPSVKFLDFQGQFFSIALVIGVVQILFGMLLNIWMTVRCFGFGRALGLLGWFIILVSCCLAMGLPMAGLAIPGFTAGSVAFYAALGVGGVLMLLLNNPKRNPLINLGAGLWDLYNNLTGLLSDVLSYIRLFAIGLSGGVLALVFNTLASGFVPEGANIVVRLLIMIPILLIGHGINLFMSTISSFVHPLRLTFVEFFKNAGFEMAPRNFDPIRKMNDTNE